MKTTTLFSFLAFSLLLSACTPGDPNVLPESERPKPLAVSEVGLPKEVEVSSAILIDARHAQAIQLLKKSIEITRTNANSLQEGCVKMDLQSDENQVRTYKVQFENCTANLQENRFQHSGSAVLKIEMKDAQEMKSISYVTDKFSEKSASAMAHKLDSDRGVVVQDETDLLLEQKEAGSFAIAKFTTNTRVATETSSKPVTIQMETPSGNYSVDNEGNVKSEYLSKVKGDGLVSGGNKSGKPAVFTVDLTKKKDSPNLEYASIFSIEKPIDPKWKPNTGVIALAEGSYTKTPNDKDGKPQTPREPVARPSHSSQFDGTLPWNFWL